jgi:hypothetical protein
MADEKERRAYRDRIRIENDSQNNQAYLDRSASEGIGATKSLEYATDRSQDFEDRQVKYKYENASIVDAVKYFLAILLLPFMVGIAVFLNHSSLEIIVGKHSTQYIQMATWLIPIGTVIAALFIAIGEQYAKDNHKPAKPFRRAGYVLLLITPIFILSIFALKPEFTISRILLSIGQIFLICVPEWLILHGADFILISIGYFVYLIVRPLYKSGERQASQALQSSEREIRQTTPRAIDPIADYNRTHPDNPIQPRGFGDRSIDRLH